MWCENVKMKKKRFFFSKNWLNRLVACVCMRERATGNAAFDLFFLFYVYFFILASQNWCQFSTTDWRWIKGSTPLQILNFLFIRILWNTPILFCIQILIANEKKNQNLGSFPAVWSQIDAELFDLFPVLHNSFFVMLCVDNHFPLKRRRKPSFV